MQSYIGYLYPFFFNLLEQFFCKMQTSRRGSRRAFVLCVYCLITVFVLQFVGYIRRQRHLSQFIQDLFKNPLVVKLDQAVAIFQHIDDLTGKMVVTKH